MPPKRKTIGTTNQDSHANKRSKQALAPESPVRRSSRKPSSSQASKNASNVDDLRTRESANNNSGLKGWLSRDPKPNRKVLEKVTTTAPDLNEEHPDADDITKHPKAEQRNNEESVSGNVADAKSEKRYIEEAKKTNEKPPYQRKKSKFGDTMAKPLATRAQGLKHYIGAHVSIAKGVHNGVLNAHAIGANAFAIFLKSQRKWDNPALQEDAVELWHETCQEHAYTAGRHVLPHGSYLVNLASQTPEQLQKSRASFLDDLQRCERLGIRLYNFHPGNTNGASKESACKKIAESINIAHGKTKHVVPVLETMASNKTTSNTVGGRFEDLALIIKHVEDKERVGVCIDTCHIFAAGYDIVSADGFRQTMEEFDRIIGKKYLCAWHLNDSKAIKGSGRDLHANIGTGFIGLRGFWNIMNMDIWGDGVGIYDLPMVLETPIDEEGGGMVPKKGEKKPEEDKGIWAREIKLLESLVGMDLEGEDFKRLEKELHDRGKGQREKMSASVDKLLMKNNGKKAKTKFEDLGEESD